MTAQSEILAGQGDLFTVQDEPDSEFNGSAQPERKKRNRRKDSDGKPMHRIVLLVSAEERKLIYKAISVNQAKEFLDQIFDAGSPSEEFLGKTVATICEEYVAPACKEYVV